MRYPAIWDFAEDCSISACTQDPTACHQGQAVKMKKTQSTPNKKKLKKVVRKQSSKRRIVAVRKTMLNSMYY